MKKRLLHIVFIVGMITAVNSYALWPDGISLLYGGGSPNDLHGVSLSARWNWDRYFFRDAPVNLTGYYDANIAYWRNDGDRNGDNKNLFTFGFVPVLRLIPNIDYAWPIAPYLDGGIGMALHNTTRIGDRDLGSIFAFQDILGVGVTIGKARRLEIGYQFMHFSNASLASENDGMDIKYSIIVAYRF